MQSKTIKQIGFLISGESTVNHWGGGTSVIDMDSTTVTFSNDSGELPMELIEKICRASVNDAQFGVESYVSASVDVYILYEGNNTEFFEEFYFENSKEQPLGNWRELSELENEYSSISLKFS